MLVLQVSKGCCNWKDSTTAFSNHEKSKCHLEGVEAIITLPATTMHIGSLLNRQYKVEVARNRKMLLKILSCIKFLARQGLPLRGHDDDGESNFIQLLKHYGEEDGEILEWL